jgi:hypothetical protein
MKEISLKIALATAMQAINGIAAYGAYTHMQLSQNAGANNGETLLIVASLFIVAKLNFTLAKTMKQRELKSIQSYSHE